MDEFSKTFIIEKELAEKYHSHLVNLKQAKKIHMEERKKKCEEEESKAYHEYNCLWLSLCQQGKLGQLKVRELDRYLTFYKLILHGKKADKILFHCCHEEERVEQKEIEIDCSDSESESECSMVSAAVLTSGESDSDVLEETSDSESDDGDSESTDDNTDKNEPSDNSTVVKSRSGRVLKRNTQ